MSTAWLEQLKAGDMVGVTVGTAASGYAIDAAPVQRMTAGRKWVYVNGAKFWLDDGRACGPSGKWFASRLVQIDARRHARHTGLSINLSGTDWRSLPLSVLEQVNAVLESHTQSKEGEG